MPPDWYVSKSILRRVTVSRSFRGQNFRMVLEIQEKRHPMWNFMLITKIALSPVVSVREQVEKLIFSRFLTVLKILYRRKKKLMTPSCSSSFSASGDVFYVWWISFHFLWHASEHRHSVLFCRFSQLEKRFWGRFHQKFENLRAEKVCSA